MSDYLMALWNVLVDLSIILTGIVAAITLVWHYRHMRGWTRKSATLGDNHEQSGAQ